MNKKIVLVGFIVLAFSALALSLPTTDTTVRIPQKYIDALNRAGIRNLETTSTTCDGEKCWTQLIGDNIDATVRFADGARTAQAYQEARDNAIKQKLINAAENQLAEEARREEEKLGAGRITIAPEAGPTP